MFWRTWHVREGSSWRTIRISKEYDCKSWSEQAARPVLFISESFIALFSAISFLETPYERFIALHLSHLCHLCPLTVSCLFSLSRLNSSELIFHLWSLSVSWYFWLYCYSRPSLAQDKRSWFFFHLYSMVSATWLISSLGCLNPSLGKSVGPFLPGRESGQDYKWNSMLESGILHQVEVRHGCPGV